MFEQLNSQNIFFMNEIFFNVLFISFLKQQVTLPGKSIILSSENIHLEYYCHDNQMTKFKFSLKRIFKFYENIIFQFHMKIFIQKY